MTSNLNYGLVAAITNALNEHDSTLFGFLARWAKAVRAARRNPSSVRRAGRIPARCGCEPGGPRVSPAECCSALPLV
jgi:hypothetical protein